MPSRLGVSATALLAVLAAQPAFAVAPAQGITGMIGADQTFRDPETGLKGAVVYGREAPPPTEATKAPPGPDIAPQTDAPASGAYARDETSDPRLPVPHTVAQSRHLPAPDIAQDEVAPQPRPVARVEKAPPQPKAPKDAAPAPRALPDMVAGFAARIQIVHMRNRLRLDLATRLGRVALGNDPGQILDTALGKLGLYDTDDYKLVHGNDLHWTDAQGTAHPLNLATHDTVPHPPENLLKLALHAPDTQLGLAWLIYRRDMMAQGRQDPQDALMGDPEWRTILLDSPSSPRKPVQVSTWEYLTNPRLHPPEARKSGHGAQQARLDRVFPGAARAKRLAALEEAIASHPANPAAQPGFKEVPHDTALTQRAAAQARAQAEREAAVAAIALHGGNTGVEAARWAARAARQSEDRARAQAKRDRIAKTLARIGAYHDFEPHRTRALDAGAARALERQKQAEELFLRIMEAQGWDGIDLPLADATTIAKALQRKASITLTTGMPGQTEPADAEAAAPRTSVAGPNRMWTGPDTGEVNPAR